MFYCVWRFVFYCRDNVQLLKILEPKSDLTKTNFRKINLAMTELIRKG